jgi:hypothetical protein
MLPITEPLSFPRIVRLRDANDRPVSEEYVIPPDAKAEVLEMLYPFVELPGLDEEVFDLHEERKFRVADFKVVRENGLTLLVSPYYYSSGGTVIDWAPAEWADD